MEVFQPSWLQWPFLHYDKANDVAKNVWQISVIQLLYAVSVYNVLSLLNFFPQINMLKFWAQNDLRSDLRASNLKKNPWGGGHAPRPP